MVHVVVPHRLTDGLTSSTRTKELQATTATVQTTTLAMVGLRRWKHPDSGVAEAIERTGAVKSSLKFCCRNDESASFRN